MSQPPLIMVTGWPPALRMSGMSGVPSACALLSPRMPFSAWKVMPFSSGQKSATRLGMPIPRLTKSPGCRSAATRMAISSRGRRSLLFRLLAVPSRVMAAPLMFGDDDAVDVDAGGRDHLRRDLAGLDQLIDLGDRDLCGHRHRRVEGAGGVSVEEVAELVCPQGFDEGEVGLDRTLHDVLHAVELAHILAVRESGAYACRCEEGRDAGAARSQALGQRALRHQLKLCAAVHECRLVGARTAA